MADGADISLKENGPILVTGEFTLTGEDGQPAFSMRWVRANSS